MNARGINFVIATLLLGASVAQAGGFAHRNADIDILYGAKHGPMNASLINDWGYAFQASYKTKW
ncbi:hypothetical protein SAMN05443582_10815 [Phyllobacterium sp. OV277]|nr:hypothetical protein SAMN05443582_10815 [Phyllobacterium sp. OV277]